MDSVSRQCPGEATHWIMYPVIKTTVSKDVDVYEVVPWKEASETLHNMQSPCNFKLAIKNSSILVQ